jgi:hypothetical protein
MTIARLWCQAPPRHSIRGAAGTASPFPWLAGR